MTKKKVFIFCMVIISLWVLLVFTKRYAINNTFLISGLTDRQLTALKSALKSEKGLHLSFKTGSTPGFSRFECRVGRDENALLLLFGKKFKRISIIPVTEDADTYYKKAAAKRYNITLDEINNKDVLIKNDTLIIFDKENNDMDYTLMNEPHRLMEEKKPDVIKELYAVDGIDTKSVAHMSFGIRSDTTIVFYIVMDYLSENQENDIKDILNKHFSDDFQLILFEYCNSKIHNGPGAEDIKKLNEIRKKIIDLGYSDTEILHLNFGVYVTSERSRASRETMNNYSLSVNVDMDTMTKKEANEIIAVMKEYYPEIRDDYFEIINQDGWVLNRII